MKRPGMAKDAGAPTVSSMTVRPYIKGDEGEINGLFNSVFKRQRSLEEWVWKYSENPASRDVSDWVTVLEKDGRISGHYASMPVRFKVGERTVTAGEPVDTMIGEDVKAGLEPLLRLTEEHVSRNRGIASFAFGMPNEKIYPIGKRFLGYRDLGVMVQHFKKLSLRSALRRRVPRTPGPVLSLVHAASRTLYRAGLALRGKGYGNVWIRTAESFDRRVDTLWKRFSHRYGVIAVRDFPYLSWRYGRQSKCAILLAEAPDGELRGYAVLKTEGEDPKVGLIMDLFSDDGAAPLLLKASLRHFISRGADFALFGAMKDDPVARSLRDCGFKEVRGFPTVQVVYSAVSKDIDLRFLGNPANWHLTYGDTDR